MRSIRHCLTAALFLSQILVCSQLSAQNPPEIEKALKVDGSRVTLPVSVAITKDALHPGIHPQRTRKLE